MSEPLVFAAVPQPECAVLMVAFGAWPWARKALEALHACTPPVVEVIVVDNASPDGTAGRLEADVQGIQLLRNERNEGFAAATNQAAAQARAPVLCLLNSDALVTPGWYPAMRARLDDPRVGAVVPMFLDLQGRVLEAGAVLGADGCTVPVGRGLDAADPSVSFPRDVDFGSAACMLVRADVFREVGGLSEVYGPGYYEDVELCLELRSRGLRTVYEPAARVQHVEGASSDPGQAASLAARSRVTFLSRRACDLEGRPRLEQLDSYPHRVVHARDRIAPIRVLVLADSWPVNEALGFRVVSALATRSQDVRVTVAAPRVDPDEMQRLLARGVEVIPDAEAASLEARPCHATVVVVEGPAAAARFGEVIARTQPQAAVVYDLTGPGGPDNVAARRAEAGMLTASQVVLAPSAGHARFVREIAPQAEIVVAPPGTPDLDRALASALALTGVALPDDSFA